MAIATIPESTAHLYQISLYVDHLAEEQGREKPGLSKFIGLNLMLDGLDDLINGLFGSTAGTNYGENNSLMVITRNYSGPALITAGAIAMILGLHRTTPPTSSTVSRPQSPVVWRSTCMVSSAFRVLRLMMAEKVDLYDPGKLAIVAMILVVGIGGNIGYGGNLPIPLLKSVFPFGWPAIAAAAVFGILVNLIFVFIKPPKVRADRRSSSNLLFDSIINTLLPISNGEHALSA